MGNLTIVDCHCHFRPFGHYNKEYRDIISFLLKAGVLFATITGIGQRLPPKSTCKYYGDCPNEVIKTCIVNDIMNMELYNRYYTDFADKIHLILSCTFIDLHDPIETYKILSFILHKYPGVFQSCGEINLCKQGLFSHKRYALPMGKIQANRPVMDLLRENNMPLTLHCDLGNNRSKTKYLGLLTEFIRVFKDNKIIWCHVGGICKELTNLYYTKHIEIIEQLLNKYQNLYIDISWDAVLHIIYRRYTSSKRSIILTAYATLFNKYPQRFLMGSDFVGSESKKYSDYKRDIHMPLLIPKLSDEAYRLIFLGLNYIQLYQLNYQVPQLK